ncbi:RNA pyrophosphohydrolase [Helicobacter apodemus]|uniref:RNA pyrophosphohydrolase n=1 Tax=Helicobacter apodemus TaxID=135569 RepID=A0A2U8FC06_9HELI|nr:RNA pyrophosphohydrolase [Helicobacter apodemus]AWI33666.1 RNA pyrophosphohydrolase [Helicobacter apodemus]
MKKETKTYRPNVAAIILSPKYPLICELFIASRTDIKNAWQFPQGGIDKTETPKEALHRELKEEIGTDAIDIIAEYPQWISYDFPPLVVKKMYPYDGQIQKYFLVRLKEEGSINIHTEEPEFDEYKFVTIDEVFNYITYFKRPVYKQVLEYFKKKGYL